MRTDILKKAAAVIGAAFVLYMPFRAGAEFYDEQADCPDFSEIRAEKFSTARFRSDLSRLKDIAKKGNASAEDQAKQLLEDLFTEFSHISTTLNVLRMECDLDVSSDAAYTRYRNAHSEWMDLKDELSDCMNSLYSAGFEEVMSDIGGLDLVYLYVDEDYNSRPDGVNKKLNALYTEENDLINKYSQYSDDDFAVEYEGESWTTNRLLSEYCDSQTEADVTRLIYEKKNKVLGDIFLDLREVRQQIAELQGYDNYAEYAFECLYLRDYSYDDTADVYAGVKKNFKKLLPYSQNVFESERITSKLDFMGTDAEDTMDILEDFFERVGGDIPENYGHLRSHHLYDANELENKAGISYTMDIFDYGVPFVFIEPSGDFRDFRTVIHEFGHANEYYEHPNSAVYSDLFGISYDTSEMHSQGMQMVFMTCSDDYLNPEKGMAFNKYTVYDMIASIIEGCLYDEFQKYAYENYNCSLEQLNDKYLSLCREYGMNDPSKDYLTFDWTEINHNYSSPMYYITYATSAVSVLDMWIRSGNDLTKASEMYKKIVDCNTYTPYKETCGKCGLGTIFDSKTLEEVAYQLNYYLENDRFDDSFVMSEREQFTEPATEENTGNTDNTDSTEAPAITEKTTAPDNNRSSSASKTTNRRDGVPETGEQWLTVFIVSVSAGVGVLIIIVVISAVSYFRSEKRK